MREPWPLPNDWHWSEWKSVARVASNLVSPADYSALPHVAPNHIESGTGKLLPYNTVADDQVISAKHLFAPGQILYSKIRPYLAKAVVVDFAGLCSADMYPVVTDLDARFLKWWMLSPDFTRFAAGEQARTVLPKINAHALGRLPVPVAPPAEQRRIVALLEDHLSRIDAARQSVLMSIRRSSALVTSSLRAIVADGSAGSPVSTVGAEAERVEYGSSAKCHAPPSDGDIPVLRMGNLKNGTIDPRDLKFLPRDHPEFPKLLLAPGDLLFNRTNSAELVGKSAVFDSAAVTSFASYLIRVRFSATVDPRWASMVINSPQGRAYIASVVTQQVGQANVNGTKLKAFPLPMPSLSRQRELVAAHERIFDDAQRLSAVTEDSLSRSAALRRSLLTSAFSGQFIAEMAAA